MELRGGHTSSLPQQQLYRTTNHASLEPTRPDHEHEDEDADSSSAESVTADVLDGYGYGYGHLDSEGAAVSAASLLNSEKRRSGQHHGLQPLLPGSLFDPDYRPHPQYSAQPAQAPLSAPRGLPSSTFLSAGNARLDGSVTTLGSEKTPTARHFAINRTQSSPASSLDGATPKSALDDLVSPKSMHLSNSSPTLSNPVPPSPWDDPAYSQPPSPERSTHDLPAYLQNVCSGSAERERDRRRPRFGEHRNSSSLSFSAGPSSAGIQKRGSTHGHPPASLSSASHKRHSQARLSGSFLVSPAGGPLHLDEAENSPPLWQKQQQQQHLQEQLAAASSPRRLQRSGSIKSKHDSRRSSRNFDARVGLETPPLSALVASTATNNAAAESDWSLSTASAVLNNSSSSHHVSDASDDHDPKVSTYPPTGAADAQKSQMSFGVNGTSDHSRLEAFANPTTSQDTIFSLDPLLQALTPASAPPMSVTHSFGYNPSGPDETKTTTAFQHVEPVLSPSVRLTGGIPSRSRSGSKSQTHHAGLSSPGLHKRDSLTLSKAVPPKRHSRGLSLSRILKSIGVGQPESGDELLFSARAVEPPMLLQRLKRASTNNLERPFLILDVRPLHVFTSAEAGRIRGSVNVNFPSLLLKRFRKGNTASFALESFITTSTGHQVFDRACPEGDFLAKSQEFDVCVVDEHITDKDFAALATTGSTGAVLVSALEKRRRAAADMGTGELWYLQGALSSVLQASSAGANLIARGSDDSDEVTFLNEKSPLHTPTLASTPRLVHSTSDTNIFKLSNARQRARALPHLTLPSSFSASTLSHSSLPAPPKSPALFRSASENDAVPQVGAETRKPRPAISLQKLDTSVKHAPPSEGKKRNNLTLAPPRSFQELAMAQAATPTKASFASAAGAGHIDPGNVAYGSDDYANEPPRTPAHGSFTHSRNISKESTASNPQYPSLPATNGTGNAPATANNSNVVPFAASVIIPGFLYLGPELVTESDVAQLEDVGIKRVLNMAVECETQERWKGRFEKIATIPMRDSLAEVGVQDRIREACVLLDDADLHGKPTYVHCKAGKSRSVTIVLAYLIHRNHWPLKKAYAHVSERRKGVCPNIGFVAELMRFEESELGFRSQGVLGTGNTPAEEHSRETRFPFNRSHSKSSSLASNSSTSSVRTTTAGEHYSPKITRTESGLPTSLDGRPTIVRHLSLIANTAMNLTADQASSRGAKDARAAARNARVRESLPPGVGFAGLGMERSFPNSPVADNEEEDVYSKPFYTQSPSRTGLQSAPPELRTATNYI